MFGFISPKIGFAMIKRHYAKELNVKIKTFELLYRDKDNTLFFVINGEKYEYKSDTFKDLIKIQVEKSKKDIEGIVDFILVKDAEPIELKLYYTDKNNSKRIITNTL
jgi:hypothetical protein